jgi:hypothetical protein
MRERVFLLCAERLRRKADDLIHEAETARTRDARERLRDAAARTLEAASYELREAGLG